MKRDLIAVLDVGKTNVRIAFVDSRSGEEIWRAQRASASITTPLGRELNVASIEQWLLAELGGAPQRERVAAIVPVAHGAAAVLVDAAGRVVAAPDYEDSQFNDYEAEYLRARDAFTATLSPALPLGLNLGRQLFCLERHHPQALAAAAHVLLYPQYWAWRLSGVMASEVTSLGCHTDLWLPRERAFSQLARDHDWVRLFPPLRAASDALGHITRELASATGLPGDCRVACGIHDSNASYLQHRLGRPPAAPFCVISSGTWTIVMASAADPSRLRAERDMLANVDAFGDIVATARFMGGREFEAIAPVPVCPDESNLISVLGQQAFAVPAFARGGPYAAHQGRLIHADRLSDAERSALATLYTTLMTELLLEDLDARGDIVIDGPLATNAIYARLLAALRPQSQVLKRPAHVDVRALCHLAGVQLPEAPLPIRVEPWRPVGLDTYRAAWRGRLPRTTTVPEAE